MMNKRILFSTLFAIVLGLVVLATPVKAVQTGTFKPIDIKGTDLTTSYDKDAKDPTYRSKGTPKITLKWVIGDDEEQRKAGYYLGVEATAPTTFDEVEFKAAKYSFDGKTWKSFYDTAKEQKTDADKKIKLYALITQDEIDTAANTDGQTITKTFYFSWDGKDEADETVKLVVNTNDLTVDKTKDPDENDIVELTIKNNINKDEEVVVLVKKDTQLRDIPAIDMAAAKTKAGYEFVRFFTQKNNDVEEVKGTTQISEKTEIIAEFKASATAPAPGTDGDQSTTKPADKDNTPKTGTTDAMGFVGIVSMLSMAGIVTLKKNYNF